MSAAPRLIDRAALRARLARSAAAGGGPDFLRRRVAEDLADRLAATLRPFPMALDLASSGPEILELLRPRDGVAAFRAGAAGQAGAAALVDPDALPFAAESLDLVVSSLALHLVDDLPGLLAQIRRSLRPDGLFLAALLGGDTLTELRQSFAAAEAEIEGGAGPRVVPFGDVRAFGGLLQRAGFALPVTDVDRVTVRYPDPLALMRDLRAWGAANMLAERRRTPLKRATLVRAIEVYGEKFADADGRVRATFEIIWLSGWAPHPDQQKPLKPGSATTRLADALGVRSGDGAAS
ncbi:class I SAM-dependent methyltransferase [Hansschlegelia quercus]|uniref:Methyltransferase domain-containing protein n=1 Tax=Hansschlegelia quercus TaxID=2528245 RepID=A0A4V2JE57_9HYPH|nr:methyltransferase domain-containing protein [Hansschlegelia quercus]TBN53976.1 methyltransferase domain-containing protein [Hansschlegelia quercus]